MTLTPPGPPLTDGVVTLRQPDDGDLDAIERGIRDPDVMRWLGRLEMSATEVLELNRTRWRDGTGATFAMCHLDLCVGHVWVNLDGSGGGAVGYWILPEARGRGLATRSVRLLARWALGDLELERLKLFAEPENLGSIRVAERSGFQREALLPSHGEINGRMVDQVLFSLLPSDLGNMERS